MKKLIFLKEEAVVRPTTNEDDSTFIKANGKCMLVAYNGSTYDLFQWNRALNDWEEAVDETFETYEEAIFVGKHFVETDLVDV